MRALLAAFSWAYLRRHPLRVLLSALTVALGVALYVSVDVSHSSAGAAFRKSSERLSGGAHLQVTRGRMIGIEASALEIVEKIPGVKAAPVLQISTTVPGAGSLLVLGVDFTRESAVRGWTSSGPAKFNPLAFMFGAAIVVTERFAAQHGLKLGRNFGIDTPDGVRAVTVGAIVKDEGAALVFGGAVAAMPVATAQRLFRREGRLDRIDLAVSGELAAVAEQVRKALGPGFEVQPPPRQNSLLDEALTRLEALIGISVVALLVGLFIIYNTVSISVLERARDIGTLRALGTTRTRILAALLVEWGLVGLAGSALGLGLGIALARVLLGMTAGEVNQVTLVADVGEVEVLLRTPVLAFAAGTLTSLFAALAPARAAMGISPLDMLRPGLSAGGERNRSRQLFFAGTAMLGITLGLLFGPLRFEGVGLAACFFAFTGVALILPQLTSWAARVIQPLLRRGFNLRGTLVADNLARSPQRSALTVIALAGSLAMMVSTTAIIQSFKVRGRDWIDQAVAFDASISAVNLNSTLYANLPLPADLEARVGALPGVAALCGTRVTLQDYGRHDVMLFGVDVARAEAMQRLRGRPEGERGFILRGAGEDLKAGRGVVVSRNFGSLHGVAAGGDVELKTLRGPRRFRVLGLYEDYTWPQGSIYLDRAVYAELWDDRGISGIDVLFEKGVAPDDGRRRLTELTRGLSLFVYDARDLKKVSDDTLDRTLAFTNAQVAVAGLIGFLGIVNTLLISVLRRTRELGLLRVVGMTQRDAAGIVVLESLFMAVTGAVLGVLLGLGAAAGPLMLHVEQISGYGMPLSIPWGAIGLAMLSAVLLGGLACILPARRAAGLNVLDAIKYE